MKLLNKEEIFNLPKIEEGVSLKSTYIYFLERNKEIIYIGISSNALARLSSHISKDYSNAFLLEIEERDYELENSYILKFRPRYNKFVKSDDIVSLNQIKDFSRLHNVDLITHVVCGKLYVYLSELKESGLCLIETKDSFKNIRFKVVRILTDSVLKEMLLTLIEVELGETHIKRLSYLSEHGYRSSKLNTTNGAVIEFDGHYGSKRGIISFEFSDGRFYFLNDYEDKFKENKFFHEIVTFLDTKDKTLLSKFFKLPKGVKSK